ncbi:radical SAM/SPASM domain-containing protein [Sinorhizobium medicae]|uniref:radical SAM/SPASM domain-containing protein n=1 Tax=Sinorhizobium medicae TaxID=110321 RepID=UPI000FD71F8B|nr:radical SAM protein [Sinorhizobium medicae]RVJ72533.1 SPASM domain-containing protein [Sinorhizobium medicae]
MEVFPFESAIGHHLLVVDGSRIYDIDETTFAAAQSKPDATLVSLGLAPGEPRHGPYISPEPPDLPSLNALSLNVAQSCNLACGYCYADQGRFGARARTMDWVTARKAVDLLLDQAQTSGRAVLGFMGGEPLLNRPLVRKVTQWAADAAVKRGVRLSFSLTTNATLVSEEDAAFFAEHHFTVAVSLDGPAVVNERQRPDHTGRDSTARALAGIERLLARDGAHVSIRATVTPYTGRLLPVLEYLLSLGSAEVGFAPVLVSPDPSLRFESSDFDVLLDYMIECGEAAKAALTQRRNYPFSNFETGLHEIARGSHRPYSCSAAAGYASVSADGSLVGCHRSVGDPAFAIGDIHGGPDDGRRRAFLRERHVLTQEPCRTCWARFLCGGGCHHEVLARGRLGCDFIRGWLRFLLASYAEISERHPDYFADPSRFFEHHVGE